MAPIVDEYKFLYQPLEISEQLVLADGETGSDFSSLILTSTIVIVAIGVLALGYIILKKLAPLIGRLKTRNILMDQPVGQSSKPSMENYPGDTEK